MKRAVIAGGTGEIGRALADELLGRGWEVNVLSRRARTLPGIEVVQWTPGARGGWETCLAGADAVVQLTGESLAAGRWTEQRKERFLTSRVVTSRVLAEAVVESRPLPSVFIQGSAVGFYGDRGDEELTETSAPGAGYLPTLCRQWEDSSRSVEAAGVRRVIARTGLVLSTDGPFLSRVVLPFRLGVGGPMGSGEQWMPWIHLRDEAAALRFLMEHETAHGAFNLVAPTPVSNEQFSRVLARVLSRPCFLRAPAFALRLALGEMSSLALEGQRALPARLLELGFGFEFSQLEIALSSLLGRALKPT